MGNGIAHVCRAGGLRRAAERRLARSASTRASPPSTATWRARSAGHASTSRARKPRSAGSSPAPTLDDLADGDLVIEAATENETVKRKIFTELCPLLKPGRDPRHQHLLDLDHPARRGHRPAGALHRHALHEPGAGDGAGRAGPRHRHRRPDLRGGQGARREARQEGRPSRRISRPSSSTASCCR